MIMLQTGSNGDSGSSASLSAGRLLRAYEFRASPFRDSPYIQSLNDLLQRELSAVEVYHGAPSGLGLDPETHAEAHQDASRYLIRLIIAQGGLPADRASSLAGGLARAMLQVYAAIPGSMNRRLALGRLTQLEGRLLRHYAEVLQGASLGDQEVLRLLHERTHRRLLQLNS